MQKMMPVKFPFTPGLDASGIVEAIGNQVTRIKAGDEVFTTTSASSYAEYVVADEDQVALKPGTVSFNEAASLAVPLATSYAVLIGAGQIQAGQKSFNTWCCGRRWKYYGANGKSIGCSCHRNSVRDGS